MPRGRPPKVEPVRNRFHGKIDSAIALIEAINAIPTSVRRSQNPTLHPKYVGQVVELAFLGIVSNWEEFLEASLVRYLAGATVANRNVVRLKHGRADDLSHSRTLLSMNPDYNANSDYLNFTNTRWLLKRADFYFANHPYTCLDNNNDLLKRATVIRNRIAHDSSKCKADFKDTAIYFLQPENDTLTHGFGPAALLRSPVERHFGAQAIQQDKNHIEAYFDLYRDLSRRIVP